MQITITIPDEVSDRVINAFCKKHSYLENGSIKKEEFISNHFIMILQADLMEIEIQEAATKAEIDAKDLIPK
jgi:hypothetical protein